MEIQQALQQLDELQKKLYAYTAAQSSLYLDGVTVAPRDTSAGRGVALGVLAGEQHKTLSDPKVGEMLEVLAQAGDAQLPMRPRRCLWVLRPGQSARKVIHLPVLSDNREGCSSAYVLLKADV